MKKAKEYYSDIKPIFEGTDCKAIKEASSKVFKALIYEIEDIIKMRKAKSNSAMKAIIEEQNNKWNSICRKAEKDGMKYLNENSIKEYMYRDLDII